VTGDPGNPDRDLSDDERRAAVLESDRARDAERGHAIIDYIFERGEDPVASFKAIMLGDPDTVRLTRNEEVPFWSVKARQLDLLYVLLYGLIRDLEKGGLYPLWTSGGPDFDRDVARAIWQIGGSETAADRGEIPAPAMAMAKIIHEYLEMARNVQNEESGYQQAYPGALISGHHDGLKLRRAGKAEWIAFTRPLLAARTFEGSDPEERLSVAWEDGVLNTDFDFDMYFIDADLWLEYNARFGAGTLRDAVVSALERASRWTGLYAVFGMNPHQNLAYILDAVDKGLKTPLASEKRDLLHTMLASLGPTWQLGELDMQNERAITTLSRDGMKALAKALFPKLKDMPAFGQDVPYRGATLFNRLDAELSAFVSGKGIATAEAREDFALAVAVFAEAFNDALADRFVAFDNPPGRSAELLRQFLKLNVTYWWSELQRRAALTSLSAYLGCSIVKKTFDQIDPAFAATLSHYGFDAAGWPAVRFAAADREPPALAESEMQQRLYAWLWDRVILVALPADDPSHERFSRGAVDFTAEAELLRFIAQFRELRAPFIPGPHGTVELRPADQAMYASMIRGDGLPALANLLIWATMFQRLAVLGYYFSKRMAAPVVNRERTWFDAASVIALGFCTDLLFGDTTTIKLLPLGSFGTVWHPSTASALLIWRKAREGKDVRAALATWAEREGDKGMLETLQITRQALNYALLHQLQDMMSPDYLTRTVKDMQARSKKSYWFFGGNSSDS